MPIYNWIDKRDKSIVVEVIRSISDFEEIPTIDEATEAGIEDYENAEWERVMHGFLLTRGPNWRGSKGNW